MRIRMAVMCHLFELRHAWQVSSLLQQRGADLPEFIIDTCVLAGENNPHRFPADMCPNYSPRVTLQYHETDRETMARRGLTRNAQLARAIAAGDDWVWFADSDRVFHPHFLAVLTRHLAGPLRRTNKLVTYKWRYAIEQKGVEALIEKHKTHAYIPDAYLKMSAVPVCEKRFIRHATGGCQIVRVKTAIEKAGGIYTDPARPGDRNMWERGHRSFSDLRFRRTIGGSVALDLPQSLHMEHNRDKIEGQKSHLTEQR